MGLVFLPIVVIALAVVTQILVASRCDWLCPAFGHIFSLSPVQAALLPHKLVGRKLATCPECGTRAWVQAVRRS